VSKRVADTAGGLYAYSLISKWNLNPEQGLQDDFDTFAWEALEGQAITLKASHESGEGPYAWEPVYRIEQVDGRTTLRYVRADPGAAAGCVSCHNDYEQQADVIAARQAAGVDPGKVFALHDLMGAIKVDVPIDVVAMAAAEGRNTMLASIMGVFFIGFGGLFLLIQRTVVEPVHASVHEVVGFQSKVDSVVECSRSLLKGAEDQVKICEAAQGAGEQSMPIAVGQNTSFTTSSSGIDDTLKEIVTAAYSNASSAEESAYHCSELSGAFGQLRTRFQKMLGGASAVTPLVAMLLLVPVSSAAQGTDPGVTQGAAAQPVGAEVIGGQTAPAQSQVPAPAPTQPDVDAPAWLTVGAEYRGRAEGSSNLSSIGGRDDSYYLNRLRVDATVRASAWLRGFVQVQDSRLAAFDGAGTPATHGNAADLRQGYVEAGRTQSGFGMRVGRQTLVYGTQRLLGALDWTNTSRAFDAARSWWAAPGWRVEAFAASVVRVEQGRFDRSRDDERLFGAVTTLSAAIPNGTLEPFIFVKRADSVSGERPGTGRGDVYTVGSRFVGKLPRGFDYDGELALQRGSWANDDIRSSATHLSLGWRPSSVARFFVEHNFASGDDDPTDGRRGTFDQLYPTNHAKYGIADLQGWRNMHDVAVGLAASPRRQVLVTAAYHRFFLSTLTDAMYSAGGGKVVTNPLAGSRDVGSEWDVTTTYTMSRTFAVQAGLAVFSSGDFLKATRQGGTVWKPYLMWTTKF
jgi:hypothetical protein